VLAGENLPDLLITANSLSNILHGNYITRPPWARFATNQLLAATAPWTVFVAAALARAAKQARDVWRKTETVDPYPVFLLLWTAIPVVFFSLSQSKLPGYILPAVPPAMVLAADYIHRKAAESEQVPFWMAGLHAVLLALLAWALCSRAAEIAQRILAFPGSGNGPPLPHSRPEPAVGSPRSGPAAAGTIVLGPTPGKP